MTGEDVRTVVEALTSLTRTVQMAGVGLSVVILGAALVISAAVGNRK
jgi:cell division protein FtsX